MVRQVKLLLVLSLLLAGCGSTVEVCYTHPKYGAVCVKVGGKTLVDPSLTPAERKEVDEWLKTQEPK
jgi:uncharacterized protein YceK